MKKLVTFLSVMFISIVMMAQQLTTDDHQFQFEGTAPINQKALLQKLQMHPSKESPIGWMIPSWNLLDYYWLNSITVDHYANLIFPDTTVRYESGGTISYVWMNGVGGAFEPYSEIFDSMGGLLINPTDPYRIDSIFILGWYNVVNPGSVDTLILEIEQGAPHTAPEFAWTVYNFTGDTINVSPPRVMGSSVQTGFLCRMTAPSKTVIKYPLTLNDSTQHYGKYITIPVNYNVNAGNIVGLLVAYVPGQPYSFGDMLFSYSGTQTQVINSFRAGFYATHNTTDDPHVFDDPYKHWNSHHYLRREIRYSMYTGTDAWRNERMVSTVSWAFDIGYYVTNMFGGTNEAKTALKNISVLPNPTSGLLDIKNVPEQTRIEIYDLVGNCRSSQMTGKNSKSIDLSGLQNGIYFMKFSYNGQTSTQKIIIQH